MVKNSFRRSRQNGYLPDHQEHAEVSTKENPLPDIVRVSFSTTAQVGVDAPPQPQLQEWYPQPPNYRKVRAGNNSHPKKLQKKCTVALSKRVYRYVLKMKA
ncbi:hypothetical protein ElyMa_000496300 [Elysia marginata]|uniref:Uncharacterized protein n=1 Tax=Elysia marginata TaxID=1093978 RepID=A0AAV4FUP4_9GAST|nr:hypothetical protein ElyMa_000496300 [Elysia marginata]